MATSSLIALIDDIATVLDDVALLTKVASQKTAGVLGDDLALNAQQVSGVRADRELPVVWAVAKGSAANKAILVPAALAVSAVAPWAINPLLMLGGLFLCFEGFEKLVHRRLRGGAANDAARHDLLRAVADAHTDLVAFEMAKIKGAVRTDLVLSAEIVAITLGTVATAPFSTQVGVLCAVSVLLTVGVYGLVAAIVKLDDLGMLLAQTTGKGGSQRIRAGVGSFILRAAPILMKCLSIAGTAAMFLVGGGILMHGIPALHDSTEALMRALAPMRSVGPALQVVARALLDGLLGVAAGAGALLILGLTRRLASAARLRKA
jgi:predicted DNA repair protein MutK